MFGNICTTNPTDFDFKIEMSSKMDPRKSNNTKFTIWLNAFGYYSA